MELIIKIPSDAIKTGLIENDVIAYFECCTPKLFETLKSAVVLPEHHGRLGDLDALEEYFKGVRKQLKASDYKNGIEFFVRDEMLLNVQQFIHLCDAIIDGSDSE